MGYRHWALALVLCGLGIAPVMAGDLWEVTTTIDGMPEMAGMGGQKRTVCLDSKTGANESAVPMDDRCTRNDFKVVGNKVTFSATCPEGKVDGDMTSTSNSYNGNMHMQSKEGDMRMKFAGKRLSTNSCEVPKAPKVPKAVAAPAAPKGDCEKMADYAMMGDDIAKTVKENESYCPGFKKTFCGKFSSFGDSKSVSVTRDKWEPKAKYCGLNPDKVAKESCDRAASGPSADFLHDNCKAEFDAQVKANCNGRDYTTKNPKYEKLCSVAASHADYSGADTASSGRSSSPSGTSSSSSTGNSASDAAKQTSDQTVEGVKKGLETLKGLFGK